MGTYLRGVLVSYYDGGGGGLFGGGHLLEYGRLCEEIEYFKNLLTIPSCCQQSYFFFFKNTPCKW